MQVVSGSVACFEPPRWAVLQDHLRRLLAAAPEQVLGRYTRSDGSLLWPPFPDHAGVDGLDDAYESLHNWPALCILGAPEGLLGEVEREYHAITRQFSRYPTGYGFNMVEAGYCSSYDWFHQGEGYRMFYDICLADPSRENSQAATHMAGYYLNEHDRAEPLWDPDRRVLRGAYVGSAGSGRGVFAEAWRKDLPQAYRRPWPEVLAWWIGVLGLPFQDIPGVRCAADLADPANAESFITAMAARVGPSDTAMNLAATSMVANAFIIGGEERYRRWVIDYVDAWWQRAAANGGVIPDNVGPSGKVGELTGAWYGGWYGWTFPHGWHSLGAAVAAAAENAARLSGDMGYLQVLADQLDAMIAQGVEKDGRLYVPHQHGAAGWYGYEGYVHDREAGVLDDGEGGVLWRDGWFNFTEMDPSIPVHLWAMSQSAADRRRVRTLLGSAGRRAPEGPLEAVRGHGKDQAGHDQEWLAFLDGEFPDYPEAILNHDMAVVRRRCEGIRTDSENPAEFGDPYLQARNPIVVEALLQLTMGAPHPIYNGGLLVSQIRWWDAERRRPGLPEGLAVLLDRIDETGVHLQVVNLDSWTPRRVVLEAGVGGEHDFTDVTYRRAASATSKPASQPDYGKWYFRRPAEAPPSSPATAHVGARWLMLEIAPLAQMDLEIGMRRHVRAPKAEAPW